MLRIHKSPVAENDLDEIWWYIAQDNPGKLMLRVPPEVHAHAAMMAEAHGKSLNQWAVDVLMSAS